MNDDILHCINDDEINCMNIKLSSAETLMVQWFQHTIKYIITIAVLYALFKLIVLMLPLHHYL